MGIYNWGSKGAIMSNENAKPARQRAWLRFLKDNVSIKIIIHLRQRLGEVEEGENAKS